MHTPTGSSVTAPPDTRRHPSHPRLDITLPVYNEQRILATNVRRLHAYLTQSSTADWQITIVDNASSDNTWTIAQQLAAELPRVRAGRLTAKGRGRALRSAWTASNAEIVAYMDIDLSTELDALPALLDPLIADTADIAIGSRLAAGARVARGPKREFISRAYNLLVRTVLRSSVRDAQCGFKAARADRVRPLLARVRDDEWFFDTELLVLAERIGLRIHELPVAWVDDPDSRVAILSTAIADLRGIWRLATTPSPTEPSDPLPVQATAGVARSRRHQALSFATIGIISTIAYLSIYNLARPGLGSGRANALGLLLTTFANTAANRRLTFGIRGRHHLKWDYVGGLASFAAGLLVTTASLAILAAADPRAGTAAELLTITAGNVGATLVRFAVLRRWLHRPRRNATAPTRSEFAA